MKRFVMAAAFVAALFTTISAEAAPSRRDTIRTAAHLQQTANYFSNYARYYNHPKTTYLMHVIAVEAGNVEKAAWRGNLFLAQDAANRAVDAYIDARGPLSEIPYYRRNYIASHVNYALNNMLRSLDESVIFGASAPCYNENSCAQAQPYSPRSISQGGAWSSNEGDISGDRQPGRSDNLPMDDRFNDDFSRGTPSGGSGGFDR